MNGVFLDASVLKGKELEERLKVSVQQEKIRFEFPQGFAQLRLIEECRALNALDVTNPDNFDLMYDITMQMLEATLRILLTDNSFQSSVFKRLQGLLVAFFVV